MPPDPVARFPRAGRSKSGRGSAATVFAAPAIRFVFAAAAGWLCIPAGAASAQEVVQALPPAGLGRLEDALRVLARDPKNAEALVEAGTASLGLGDVSAAIGFLGRADDLRPGDPRVQAGLARAALQSGDPVNALTLFAAAERAGARPQALATDRGLAYDLVGDPRAAQAEYARALSAGADDEATRRLAISQAVAGQRAAMEATLRPLLQRQDRSAFRARAFALAILGDTQEAVGIATAVMPAQLSAKIAPYLSYMPRLTRGQQAAAANLGQFPRAAEIGRDDPRIAAYRPAGGAGRPATMAANAGPANAAPRSVDAASGTGISRSDARREARRQAELARAPANVAPNAARGSGSALSDVSPAQIAAAPAPTVAPASRPVLLAGPPVPAPVPGPATNPATGAAGSALAAAGIAARPAPAGNAPPSAATPAWATTLPMTVPTTSASAGPSPSGTPRIGTLALPDAGPATRAAGAFGSATAAEGGITAVTPRAPVAIVLPPSEPALAAIAPQTIPAGGAAPIGSGATAAAAVPELDTVELAEAFAAFAAPLRSTAPATGAVDLTAIDIRREAKPALPPPPAPKAEAKPVARTKPAPPPPPAPPPSPSRVWVQVATGRDVKALAFDWRRIARTAGAALNGEDAFVADWGRTRRLLTGPYSSARAAAATVSALKGKDLDAFVYTSPTGEVVDPLPGG